MKDPKKKLFGLILNGGLSRRMGSDKSKKMDIILSSIKRIKGDIDLPWLELDKANMSGTFLSVPGREEMQVVVNEQLIVELYSK